MNASKEIGVKVNAEKTYVFVPDCRTKSLYEAAIKPFEHVAKFIFLGMMATN